MAVYTTYIPLIYCLLGGYIIPTTLYRNLKNPLKSCFKKPPFDVIFCWLQRCRFLWHGGHFCDVFFLPCSHGTSCYSNLTTTPSPSGCQPKIRGKTPKMDGENNGKPYEQMDDLEGFSHPYFWVDTQVLYLQQPQRRSCQADYSKEEWMQDTTGLFEGAGRETINSPHCLDVRRVWSGGKMVETCFILLMAEILHQLRLVVYPIIYRV